MLTFIFITIIFAIIIGINFYNTLIGKRIMMLPGSVFSGTLDFQPFTVLENTAKERKNINAKDLFNN
ncbi:hypothetical protein HDF26_003957 [Pedobacter cryoconitis]|uniref:hypothetical protein n=1 Tax=Pedobacter cryoconitis TaxID=188932 RepID=UPI0016112C9E|nr:hypothetical protein [Pedobacter cryoconitis]MBB6273497.1 hypothetical protein [Pedobacter cryoconitis]